MSVLQEGNQLTIKSLETPKALLEQLALFIDSIVVEKIFLVNLGEVLGAVNDFFSLWIQKKREPEKPLDSIEKLPTDQEITEFISYLTNMMGKVGGGRTFTVLAVFDVLTLAESFEMKAAALLYILRTKTVDGSPETTRKWEQTIILCWGFAQGMDLFESNQSGSSSLAYLNEDPKFFTLERADPSLLTSSEQERKEEPSKTRTFELQAPSSFVGGKEDSLESVQIKISTTEDGDISHEIVNGPDQPNEENLKMLLKHKAQLIRGAKDPKTRRLAMTLMCLALAVLSDKRAKDLGTVFLPRE